MTAVYREPLAFDGVRFGDDRVRRRRLLGRAGQGKHATQRVNPLQLALGPTTELGRFPAIPYEVDRRSGWA